MLDKYLRTVKEAVLIPVVDLSFSSISPNTVTLIAGVVGCASAIAAADGQYSLALALWALNRILDGLDGVVARRFNKQTDFGGYLDIIVDFVVYAIIPIGLTWSQRSSADAESLWVILALLLSTFFVNAAGLFQLAAILEKSKLGAKTTKELTTVTMPDGLIEGSETVAFYTVFILFPDYLHWSFSVFALCVSQTIVQRVLWAYGSLDRPAAEDEEKKK